MDLQLSRLRTADRLVAGAAIALLVFMFLFDWFGESHNGTLPGSNLSGVGGSSSGWDTFTNSRWVWLLTIVVAIASVLASAGGRRPHASLQLGAVVLLLGALSSVLIAYRIVHHPVASVSFGGFHASFGIKFGIWLGLLAALTITGGAYLQLRAEQAPATAADDLTDTAFSGLTAVGDGAPYPPAREDDPPPSAQDAS